MTMETTPAAVDGGEEQNAPATTREAMLDTSSDALLSAGLLGDEAAQASTEDGNGAPDAGQAGGSAQAGDGGQASAAGGAEGNQPPTDSKAAPPPRTTADYVEMLALNPNRATEVPAKERDAVVARAEQLRQALYQQAAQDILTRVEAQAQQHQQVQQQIAPFIELLEAEDIQALNALEEDQPEAAELFHQWQAQQAAARKPAPVVPPSVVALQLQAREQMGFLRGDEAALARITANYQAGKYGPTAGATEAELTAGLAVLKADIEAEVNGTASTAPAAGRTYTPAQRQAAARARAALPRVDASPGGPQADGRTSAKEMLTKSASDLIAAGLN